MRNFYNIRRGFKRRFSDYVDMLESYIYGNSESGDFVIMWTRCKSKCISHSSTYIFGRISWKML